jgi:hypothetical protein
MSRAESVFVYHLAAAATGAVMLAVLTLLAIAIAPGEWFVRYQLDVVRSEAGDADIVIQTRTMLLPCPYRAGWIASVERIREDGVNTTACSGGGYDVYQPDQRTYSGSLSDWVGDPDCKLTQGERYRIEAVWRYSVFGFIPQETSAVSAAFIAQ